MSVSKRERLYCRASVQSVGRMIACANALVKRTKTAIKLTEDGGLYQRNVCTQKTVHKR